MEMDSAQYKYLRLNKYYTFMICTWPYQTVVQRCLVGIVYIPIISAQLILQVEICIVKYAQLIVIVSFCVYVLAMLFL